MVFVRNPKVTTVAINGSAGALVLISATQFDGYIEIQECPPGAGAYAGGAFTGQGLNYQRADEGYTITHALIPGQILQLGNAIHKDDSIGVPARSDPAGQAVPATPFFKLISATVTATQVEFREWRQEGPGK